MIAWIEIPVIDLERATAFYAEVFRLTFEREDIGDGNVKSLFPASSGMSGALSQGPDWTPSRNGVLLYFAGGDDLQVVLDRVVAAGGAIVEPKQTVDATSGYWARFSDSEGNLIGLLSPH
jgi:predicted enzyme related to lactoylglutathione lyase